jgi:hypothetical protein
MSDRPKDMDAASCRKMAGYCRNIADVVLEDSHRIMLLHMAETWERIAEDYELGGSTH